jgi:uncharacterized protein
VREPGSAAFPTPQIAVSCDLAPFALQKTPPKAVVTPFSALGMPSHDVRAPFSLLGENREASKKEWVGAPTNQDNQSRRTCRANHRVERRRSQYAKVQVMPTSASETALHLQAAEAAERQRGTERAARLLAHASEARSVLVDRYGAQRVWLFGSLVAGQPTPESDVDLAAQGLDGSVYFSALAELMALFQGPVDLVRIEEASESLRDRVLSEGREL